MIAQYRLFVRNLSECGRDLDTIALPCVQGCQESAINRGRRLEFITTLRATETVV